MRSIPSLDVNAAEVFDDIATAKRQPRRQRMIDVRGGVLDAYNEYEDALPEVGDLDAIDITAVQKEALQHAYTVETAPMTALREALIGRPIVARCPFCGIGETATLDHYLPKEKYPEFSIFPPNLVPSCGVCNLRKNDLVVDGKTEVRLFLHPCFDPIPDGQFMRVRTRIRFGILSVTYQMMRPPGMEQATFQRLSSHFDKLNLADRYRRMSLGHLGEQYRSFFRAYGTAQDAARVSQKLLESAEEKAEVFGENFWLVLLYRALAANQDFRDGGFEAVRGHGAAVL